MGDLKEENNRLHLQLQEIETKNKFRESAHFDAVTALQNQRSELEQTNSQIKEKTYKLEMELRILDGKKKVAEDKRDEMGRSYLKLESEYEESKKTHEKELKKQSERSEESKKTHDKELKKQEEKSIKEKKNLQEHYRQENAMWAKLKTELNEQINTLKESNHDLIVQRTEQSVALSKLHEEAMKYPPLVDTVLLINTQLIADRDRLRSEKQNLLVIEEDWKKNSLIQQEKAIREREQRVKELEKTLTENQKLLKQATEDKVSSMQKLSKLLEELINLKEENKNLKETLNETKRSLDALEREKLENDKNFATRLRDLLDERNDLTCVICLEFDRNTLLSPCQHLCVCQRCSSQITKCPRCDGIIKKKHFAQIRETLI